MGVCYDAGRIWSVFWTFIFETAIYIQDSIKYQKAKVTKEALTWWWYIKNSLVRQVLILLVYLILCYSLHSYQKSLFYSRLNLIKEHGNSRDWAPCSFLYVSFSRIRPLYISRRLQVGKKQTSWNKQHLHSAESVAGQQSAIFYSLLHGDLITR